MQILEGENDRLSSRARQNPGRHRRQLPTPQFLGRRTSHGGPPAGECRPAARAGARIRPRQGRSAQSVLEVGETPLVGRVGAAKAQSAPFGERVQGRVLQELRGGPFDPGVRRLGEFCAELLDEARLADAGLADDLDELTLAFERARPAALKEESSSSRPTSGVRARAPPRRPPPLARTMR